VTEDVHEVSGGGVAGFRPGSRIAGYVLEEQVGAGGMAVVFRAHDERLDRKVALKILAPALAADQAFRQRFIRESRTAASIDDPHIIPVFEAGEADGVLYIAMRYVGGGDVRSLLTQAGPLAPGRVAEIISQVSSALDAAHERGLVHRDVKPANMLLDSRAGKGRPDHVYLSDFGLTKAALAVTGLTAAGQFLGTVDYISPEQIEGRSVDGRADQYALACAAFELLTGEPPFRRDEVTAVMFAQLSQPPPDVTSRRPGLPAALDAALARALSKSPADRWASCREFSDALLDALGIRPRDSGELPVPETTGSQQAASGPGRESSPAGPRTQLAPWQRAGSVPVSESAPGIGASGDGSGQDTLSAGQNTTIADPRPVEPVSGATEVISPRSDEARPGDASRGRRRGWRSPRALAGAVAVLLALGGGAAYVAWPNSKKVVPPLAFLPPPACSTTTAAGKTLTTVATKQNQIFGSPFGVQVTSDGKYVFASTAATLDVLAITANQSVARQYHYYVAASGETAKGIALSSDGKYIAIALGNGINIQGVGLAEQGGSSANVANLTVPGLSPVTNAVDIAFSPGDQFAFLTLQNSNELAVFNFQKALSGGATQQGVLVGTVTLGVQPGGMAVSPDGQWLYVTSSATTGTAPGTSEGLLSVLSIQKLETDPRSAVVSQATAGCGPAGVVVSPDGKTVWVTAEKSNDLLGFSAAKLRSDPKKALMALVRVGQTPTGEIMVDGTAKMIVADTNLNGLPGADNLAVVDLAAALARKPALTGYIPSGKSPRDLAVAASGRYLYVSDSGSAQIQVVNLSTLP
jgi:serine/threonine protein kinase/DNA-binding beta-propeller fold protein YncE